MIIGVPKEIKNHEYRVGMVPGGVQAFVAQGHEVLVEKDAGAGSYLSDEAYTAAGAKIIDEPQVLWSLADMIVKVKEPITEEYSRMKPGQIVYTYLHLASVPELAHALLEREVTAIAYETIELPSGRLPLLQPMSEVAGRMSIQVGARCLEREYGGSGVLLGGVPGVRRGNVVIIGGGVVGTEAAKIAMGMGAITTIMDVNTQRLGYLDDVYGSRLQTIYSNPTSIAECVSQADLVVGAVLLPGARAPKLVTREMIVNMRPGSVIVDVSIDQGGCIETARPTTHQSPTYVEHDVVHYCVTNMPGAVPRTSTFALTNVTLGYGLALASRGLEGALERYPELRPGVNSHSGVCRNRAVAESCNLEFSKLGF